ncbi:uncharacterized protein PV06_07704 [Exophiala oligosperma]|uniref:Uncharacterized protein n=2 Tax=Chaetothyriales TaxID=34395 RepID=A0A0D2DBS5_9EURO|nr:uncharacterized protein PV06_07704 [Exophiala oligosperma]KAJ9645621.1 hypothetical protein H2204_001202 [Knufia peltigerae]KIW40513.1 hypothetical protein PV06_07704 [Exophiala oligosperma]
MDSAGAPGMADHPFAQDQSQDWVTTPDELDMTPDKDSVPGKQPVLPKLETEGLYDDDMIGVSISRVQTHMRAPETPAFEKARAMNLSLDYFQNIVSLKEEPNENDELEQSQDDTPEQDFETISSNERVEEPSRTRQSTMTQGPSEIIESGQSSIRTAQAGLSQAREQEIDLPKVDQPHHKTAPQPVERREVHIPQSNRLSYTRNLLQAVGQEGRRRASSGPTAIMSSLKKLMPDLPSPTFNFSSMSLFPASFRSTGHSGASTPNPDRRTPPQTSTAAKFVLNDGPRPRKMSNPDIQVMPSQSHPIITRPYIGLDGNIESLLSPVSPASTKSRARSNSEGSLYIRRRVSGVSAYDDTSAFANVTDMANSRFKAITDSFQNSTLRLPKLPVIRPSPKRRISPANSSMNIRTNDVSDSSRGPNHQYTSIKGIRNVKKGLELGTPQQRAHPILSHALSKTTGDVVLLGGYRGSILRSAQPPHRQVWVPVKVGLNLRRVDLEVGLTREDEERMEETIIPSGVLSHIGPIDICRRLLKHLHKCPNTRQNKLRVHDWGYDWRLSPHLLAARLIKFLESLECNHPETPPEKRGATVIAHSLGGLITRYAVNQRPDLFAGVVYAGVPQHCVNILGPLRNGDDVLLSSRVLTAQVNFTLRTSFALLPESGRCFIQKHTNKRYDLNFFDPEVWDEYRLSPCINPPLHRTNNNGDGRKSIIGAISGSISSNKRSSWFGGQSIQTTEPVQKAEGVGPAVADKAAEVGNVADGEGPEEVVGPTMKQAQHRPSVATACTIPKDQAKEYLSRTLAEILDFKKALAFNPTHQESNRYPPHAYIFGKTVPTVYGARVPDEEAIKYTEAFDDLAFAAGDGVVLASAAQLPEGYRCVKGGRVESDRGHVGLMGDLEGVGRCIEAVVNARAKGVGLGEKYLKTKKNVSESSSSSSSTS